MGATFARRLLEMEKNISGNSEIVSLAALHFHFIVSLDRCLHCGGVETTTHKTRAFFKSVAVLRLRGGLKFPPSIGDKEVDLYCVYSLVTTEEEKINKQPRVRFCRAKLQCHFPKVTSSEVVCGCSR